MWCSENAPASLGGNVEFSSAEWVSDVGLAGNSVEYLVELASVAPSPM